MSIFKKNIEEDEIDEEELDNRGRSRNFHRKNIKDLNSENKKKRKEPPKPWTKKERYLILGVLVGTILLSILFYASARDWKLPNWPKLSLPSFTTKTIVITATKGEREKTEKIIGEFKNKTKALSGDYVFYYFRLTDGYSYGVEDGQEMKAASLIKLPVIAALYQQAEKGKIDLDEKYILKNSDKISGYGTLYSTPAGTPVTFQRMIELMCQQSDNTAFNIVRNRLGDSLISEVISSIGMGKTSVGDNTTTAYDIGLFFRKLWEGKIVSAEHKEEFLKYLTDTIFENWLVAGITDVRVAHKYGVDSRIVNDAGIVFDKKPFVLVIMSKGIIEKEANQVIPELAKMIYEGQKN